MKNIIEPINAYYDGVQDEWHITIQDLSYKIYCLLPDKGIYQLYVNDKQITLPKSSIIKMVGFDHEIQLEDEKIYCVYDGETFDVAIKGKYIKSKRNYVPIKEIFRFTLVMVLLFIVEVFLIMTDTMTIQLFVLLFGILFINIGYRDYILKKVRNGSYVKKERSTNMKKNMTAIISVFLMAIGLVLAYHQLDNLIWVPFVVVAMILSKIMLKKDK